MTDRHRSRQWIAIGALVLVTGSIAMGQTTAPATQPKIPDNSAYILTPPAPATPRINGPSVFGVRPGSPLLYRIPATGDRPMTFGAEPLPPGVSLDASTGQLSGAVEQAGTYSVTLHAKNEKGTADRAFRIVVGDTIALTPPMGWNSYNVWSDQINQERELAAARAMVSSGLINHGWTYVNMDDGWQGARGGEFNALQPDERRFTDIKGMVDQIHAMGLKVGIYSSPWVMTYAGRLGGSAENPEGTRQQWPPGAPKNQRKLPFAIGKYHFVNNDTKQFEAWGIDYLKFDWGPVEYPETKEAYDALRSLHRDIVFSLSNNHVQNLFGGIAEVSKVSNAWRTTTDITDNWKRVADDIGFNQEKWAPFASPGHYNDADMLVIGVVGWGAAKQHATKLTVDEQYTHITLWAMLPSPLLLGCDLDKLDPFTLSLLTNDEVLAVNQDSLVQPAKVAAAKGDITIYMRELEDGSHAVALFNRGPAAGQAELSWSEIGLTNVNTVRDLWRQQDIPDVNGKISIPAGSHGAALLKVTTK